MDGDDQRVCTALPLHGSYSLFNALGDLVRMGPALANVTACSPA